MIDLIENAIFHSVNSTFVDSMLHKLCSWFSRSFLCFFRPDIYFQLRILFERICISTLKHADQFYCVFFSCLLSMLETNEPHLNLADGCNKLKRLMVATQMKFLRFIYVLVLNCVVLYEHGVTVITIHVDFITCVFFFTQWFRSLFHLAMNNSRHRKFALLSLAMSLLLLCLLLDQCISSMSSLFNLFRASLFNRWYLFCLIPAAKKKNGIYILRARLKCQSYGTS